jgi:hypothetical protein
MPRTSPFETKETRFREMELGAPASDRATFACPKTGQAAAPAKITEPAASQHPMQNRG